MVQLFPSHHLSGWKSPYALAQLLGEEDNQIENPLTYLKAVWLNQTELRWETLEVMIFFFKGIVTYLLTVCLMHLGDRHACVCPCVFVLRGQPVS